jgi:hypothetical protein
MTELFPEAPMQVSLERQLRCVEREIGWRRRVYPQRVAVRRMTQAQADEEIAVMTAVAATLRQLIGERR